MQQSNQFLGTAPIPRLLRRLALPTVTAQVINMLYNIVDRIYIGHMPAEGALALTGVGVCMPVIMVVTAFASLVASGGAPRASIAMGRGDEEEAQKILGSCFLFQVLISLLLSAVLLLWGRPVLLAFGASENTITYATDYLSVYALGTLFVQLTLGMNAFITAQGFTKISMASVMIGAVCNIVLDPIFIYALGMGVRGAALATILSQAVSCCWVLLFLTGKKTLLRLQRRNLRLSPRILLPCLALGLAPFIMGASESIIAVCYNSSLLAAGGDIAVGAMTILTSVMQFALLPLQGLGQGAQPIASYNYGAKKPQRVRATFWLLLKVSLLYSALFWALLMLAPQVFVGMFTADAALAAFTIGAVRVYFAVLLVFGLQVACQMTFIAIGSAKASIVVAVMRKFVLLIPLIYTLPRLFSGAPTTAIYAAEPVADLLAVTFTAVLFGVQFKKSMKKLETGPVAPAVQ
ncbi:MAG: MATE family efflux transporter [Pygmaiobacter sp.]|jgi:putative MATE family efflux protein|nr:MATE family efflux transporter [Pygmaiobacter sp.]